MKIEFSFLVIMLFSFYCYVIPHKEQFYSKSFLKNYKATRTALKDINFKKITFTTTDNLKLVGLFLSRSDATCNVIICAGWLPGRKEGMATFYDLLPEYCNILFFDARGRGESEGSLIWNVWRYGVDEYKDIIAAISWINNNNELPIIIGGTCSGVFNAAHAILHIIKNNTLEQSRIKGLIFDSGWGSVIAMSQSSAIANIKKYFIKTAVFIEGTKKKIAQKKFYTTSYSFIISCFKIIHRLCAKPLIISYEKTTNLFDKIHQITIPILFIHSYDDTHAAFSNVYKLAKLTPNKQCWWIETSSHAKHHLIHKELYKEKVIAFIENVIP